MTITKLRDRVPTRRTGFEDFYRADRDRLYRALALTLRDTDLAVDAVDEGMARAYQRWQHIGAYDNPAGWVYRVAFNWATSRLRRRSRSVLTATPPETGGAGPPQAPDDALARALAALPAQQRAVTVLRFHLDWSLEQIAVALDIPAGTVKSRLHRGLATLRALLEDHNGS